MSTIKSEWESYLNEVLPKDAPPEQRAECQKAFYAGATASIAMVSVKCASNKKAIRALKPMMDEALVFQRLVQGLAFGQPPMGGGKTRGI